MALYSDIDIISSMCMLMARGALISMGCVIFFLPALLMFFDGLIRHTTAGMKPSRKAATPKPLPAGAAADTATGIATIDIHDTQAAEKETTPADALKYIGILAGVGLGVRFAFKLLKNLFL